MSKRAQGFTLIELMVIVVILAVLAMVAVPALTKDNRSANFEKFCRRFAIDAHRAHMEAISSREDRSLLLYSDRYTVNAVLPGSTTAAIVAVRQYPDDIEVYGLAKVAADPGRTYTEPGQISGGEEIRFRATGDVGVDDDGTGSVDVSASVFLRTTDNKFKGRVVIYQSTSFIKYHKGW